MNVVYAFLKTWWKEIFIAAVIIGAIAYVRNLQLTVEKQNVTIAQLDVLNGTLAQSNKTLTEAVKRNSQALAVLSDSAGHTKEEFAKLNDRVAGQTQEITNRLGNILNKPVPVTCDDTIDYMVDAVPTYGLQGRVAK